MGLRVAAAVLITAHGVMHWPGFAVPWKLLELRGVPYATTVLGGSVDLGETGIRAFGLLWMAVTMLFLVAAVGIWRAAAWSIPLTAGAAILSFLLALANQPVTWEGLVINGIVLVLIGLLTFRSPARQQQREP